MCRNLYFSTCLVLSAVMVSEAAALTVPPGTQVTKNASGTDTSFTVAGRLIVEPGADLTFTGPDQSHIDGTETGGIRPEIIVNGGLVFVDARTNMGTDKVANGGNHAYLTMNGGYFRIGTVSSTADSGDLKLPDDPGGEHRIHLNGGILRVHRLEPIFDRDAHIIVGGGKLQIDDVNSWDPGDWLSDINPATGRPGLIPAEGYYYVAIDYDVPLAGGAEVYAVSAAPFAKHPSPADDAEGVCPNAQLSWTEGEDIGDVNAHDVYFGTDYNAVRDANTSNDPWSVYAGRHDTNLFAPPSSLEWGTTYYWRIDEVNESDPNIWQGLVWSFTTNDGNAYNPKPAHGETMVPLDVRLTWTPGCFATRHHVYFGTDFEDVKDANSTATSEVYKGYQGPNSYDPGPLELHTTYHWRIDEARYLTCTRGRVWSFKTPTVRIIDNVIVYHDKHKWCATPSNCGVYTWGDEEILVGFVYGPFIERPGHNVGTPIYSVLARSTDGGHTWKMEDPDDFVGDGGTPVPSPGDINFAHPDFAMRVVGTGYHGSDLPEGAFFISYDRGHNWQGPYEVGNFGDPEADSWERTPRTDYIVNGPNDCLVFMSVRSGDFGTDRAFCVRTTDGGATFQFQGWIVPPADPYRAVMPSTVRCSPTKLVTAVRRRAVPDDICWIDAYVSTDNGLSWSFLSQVADTGDWNGNPPALLRLRDGRLCCVYGNRADRTMKARFSEDEGRSWRQELILRNDYQVDYFDDPDLGYPRLVQRPDGMLVTAYFWATADHPEVHIAGTVWNPGLPSCVVDSKHFALWARHWLEGPCDMWNRWCGGADLDHLNGVDFADLKLFCDKWLKCCPYGWPFE
ncbi:MAG: exo-alpha-sialidase [Planctomycetota bacterium]